MLLSIFDYIYLSNWCFQVTTPSLSPASLAKEATKRGFSARACLWPVAQSAAFPSGTTCSVSALGRSMSTSPPMAPYLAPFCGSCLVTKATPGSRLTFLLALLWPSTWVWGGGGGDGGELYSGTMWRPSELFLLKGGTKPGCSLAWQASYGCSVKIFATDVANFCLTFELLRVQPCWLTLHQWRANNKQKRLTHELMLLAAIHARWVHDVTDFGHNGRNQCRFFVTFRGPFLTK